jgi:Flp pilus assembly pilin Flp
MKRATLARRITKGFAGVAKDCRGVAALEYGLLAALLITAIILGARSYAEHMQLALTNLGQLLVR